ncbi:MAG: hypothetical protein H7Z75_03945 [Ferruginibacter sp.]|nr:hypothetical protein [Cytophagales bacterium]
MYEHRNKPLLSRKEFFFRLVRHGFLAGGIVLVALAGGILGYHAFEGLAWIDATVNAAMILGGMGPVDKLHTTAGKLFASIYALFSGLVFIAIMGLLLAPFAHRLLHRFHLGA